MNQRAEGHKNCDLFENSMKLRRERSVRPRKRSIRVAQPLQEENIQD